MLNNAESTRVFNLARKGPLDAVRQIRFAMIEDLRTQLNRCEAEADQAEAAGDELLREFRSAESHLVAQAMADVAKHLALASSVYGDCFDKIRKLRREHLSIIDQDRRERERVQKVASKGPLDAVRQARIAILEELRAAKLACEKEIAMADMANDTMTAQLRSAEKAALIKEMAECCRFLAD